MVFRTIETHPLHYQMLNYIYEKQAITEIYFCEIWREFLNYLKNLESTTNNFISLYKTPTEYRYLFYTEILPNIYLYFKNECVKRRYFQFIYSYEIADIMETYYKNSCERDSHHHHHQASNEELPPGILPRTITTSTTTTTTTTTAPNANTFKYNRNTLREYIRNSIQSNFEQPKSTGTGDNQNNISIVTQKIFNLSFEYGAIASNSLTCPAVAIASYYMSTPEERLRYVFHTKDELCKRIEAKRQEFLLQNTLFKLNEDGTTIEDYLLNTIDVRLMDELSKNLSHMVNIPCHDELSVNIRNINDYQNQNKYDALKYSTNYQSLVKQHLIKLKITGDSTIRNRIGIIRAIKQPSPENTELITYSKSRENTINKRKLNSKKIVTVRIPNLTIDDDQTSSSTSVLPEPTKPQSPSFRQSTVERRRSARLNDKANRSQLSTESISSSPESRITQTQSPSVSSIASINNSSFSSMISNRESSIIIEREQNIGRNNDENSRITSTPTDRSRRLLMRNRQRFTKTSATKTFNISSVLFELPETDDE